MSDLVKGFWDNLNRRMQGRQQKGVVKRVPKGSGVSLAELAQQEEADTGIKANAFMLGPADDN